MKGKFITFEGLDGTGKTTQIQALKKSLEKEEIKVLTTREPGGTRLGEKIRNLIFENTDISLETETLLLFSARMEHLKKVIIPSLDRGEIILCDRFTDSTYAYQSGGDGLDEKKIEILEKWVNPHLQPDLTFYFNLPINLVLKRIKKNRENEPYEQKKIPLFKEIENGYKKRMEKFPQRFVMVDCEEDIQKINEFIFFKINQLITVK